MRLAALLLLCACTGDPPPVECRDDGDCSGVSMCDLGECVEVECLSSAQCALESFCDIGTHACAAGCEVDDDCLSGSACDATSATCAPTDCVDSQLDCYLGEVCDLDVGECAVDTDTCLPCTGDGSATCRDDIGGECRFFATGSFCLPPCSPFTDPAKLPRGFACMDLDGSEADERWRLYGDCAEVDARRPDR